MPRKTDFKIPGAIPIPADLDRSSWKIIITDIDDAEIDVTDYVEGTLTLMATQGVSNFVLTIDNNEGRFKDKFVAGKKVDIYYGLTEKANLTTVRLRGYIDGVYDNVDNTAGFTLTVEGRNCPRSTNFEHFVDTHITLQFTSRNNLDCWYGTTGTQDSLGNFPDGVLYNSGLKFQIFDTADSSWKVWDDLSTNQKDAIKLQEGYTKVHSNNYVDSPRVTISKELATEGDYDFYIYYDSGAGVTYLRVHPEEVVTNSAETITAGQNLISLGRFGKDTTTEINRFKQNGFTDGSILLMRTKEDVTRQQQIWIKDREELSNSLDTDDLISARATAKIAELKEAVKTGNVTTALLPTIQPGERVTLNLPYVHTGLIKLKLITISFGEDITCSIGIQNRETKFEDLFKDRIDENVNVLPTNNPNGMENAFVYDFTDETKYLLTNCQIVENVLVLDSGQTEGTCITVVRSADDNLNFGELRIAAGQFFNCSYRISVDGGSTYVSIAVGTLFTLPGTGKDVVLEITLLESTSGVSPEFDKVNLLFK